MLTWGDVSEGGGGEFASSNKGGKGLGMGECYVTYDAPEKASSYYKYTRKMEGGWVKTKAMLMGEKLLFSKIISEARGTGRLSKKGKEQRYL